MSVPLARFGGSVTYDPIGNRIIVHGGCWWNCSPALADTWFLDNANGLGETPLWHRLPDAPIGRASHSAVFDPGSGRLIVFGGDTAFWGTERNDVWVLDVATGSWSALSPSGPLPLPRNGHTAVYDHAGNRMIVFEAPPCWSGSALNDTCPHHANGFRDSRSGSSWLRRLRSPRGHSAVFDASTRRMTIVGGVSTAAPTRPPLRRRVGVTSAVALTDPE
jgi:hypothetical protein